MTRDYGLLVKDQDILDLVWSCTRPDIIILARRLIAIQDAIEAYDLRAIDRIAKESSDPLFRRVVKAIKRGLKEHDADKAWCAAFTTKILIGEAFSKTPAYYRALRAFCANLREMREQRGALR